MGLIARHLETLGYPTVSMTSSWVITASVNPPRASFLNYPLGHTAGRPNDLTEQITVTRAALELVHSATEPGQIVPLPHEWAGPWRDKARELSDNRTERHDEPQYQHPEDAAAAGAIA